MKPFTVMLSSRTIYLAAMEPIRPIPGKPTIIVEILSVSLQIHTVLSTSFLSTTDT